MWRVLANRRSLMIFLTVISSLTLLAFGVGCGSENDSHAEDGHDDHGAEHDDHGAESKSADSGPHGGKLVTFGEYVVEVAIFEDGVPPEFRLYVSAENSDAAALDPTGTTIELTRADRVDKFTFRQTGDFITSNETIGEPHEFDVSITVRIGGREYSAKYHQEETHGHAEGDEHGHAELGSLKMSDEALRRNGVRFATAGSGVIARQLELPGEITLNADKVAHIVPRFPGIAQRVYKNLGDRVNEGDVLAIIQSNASVSPYEVKSLISGTIIEKHITLGEFIRDDADIFVVADLSTVWAQISVYANYLAQVRPGLKVRLYSAGIKESVDGVIDYVGPIVGERTRTGAARVTIKNPAGTWQPGLFVRALVALEETPVELAVPDEAIQTVEGKTAIFVREGDAFAARPVQIGRSDGKTVEILSGLKAGEEFVAANSFLFKAEFGKSEAGHDH